MLLNTRLMGPLGCAALILLLGGCARSVDAPPASGLKLAHTIAKLDQQAIATQTTGIADIMASDAAITAGIKARLVADVRLQMLNVIVGTVAGQVTLYGIAPSALARTRATEIAWAEKGVVGVSNQLSDEGRTF
jgi:PBP1b-binding outer membrane lipoprotein LpoB